MLITFLDISTYEAIGIDLASAVLALTYWKSKNVDLKNGIIMFIV